MAVWPYSIPFRDFAGKLFKKLGLGDVLAIGGFDRCVGLSPTSIVASWKG
jgi:hypothetical protein